MNCPSHNKSAESFQRLCRASALLALSIWLPASNLFAQKASAAHPAPDSGSTIHVLSDSDLDPRIAVANQAEQSGNPKAVAEADEHALSLAYGLLAQIRLAEHSYPQAMELYQSSLEYGEEPGVKTDLAISAVLAGKPETAIAPLKTEIAREPRNAALYTALGRAYLAQKDYPHATEMFSKAADLKPDLDSFYSLALAWLATPGPEGRKQADAVFARIRTAGGDSGNLHVLIGRAYHQANLSNDAVKELQRAVQLDPATPHAYYFLGIALLAQNEWKPTPEAQAALEQAVKQAPRDYLPNYMLGSILSTGRQYQQADQYLKIASEAAAQYPQPWLYLGLDAYAEGDQKTAESYLRKAVDLTGSNESESNYEIRRAYVDLGRILASSGRQDEADQFLAKARALENKVMKDTQQRAAAMFAEQGAGSAGSGAIVAIDRQGGSSGNGGPGTVDAPSTDPYAQADSSAIEHSNLSQDQRKSAAEEDEKLRTILGQVLNQLGTSEALLHDYSSAATHFEQAGKWQPETPGLSKNLGQSAFLADRYDLAQPALAKALEQQSNSRALRAMLGVSDFMLEKYGDAANTFYPLGEEAMKDPRVGYAWAESLTQTGDLKDASQVLTLYESTQLSPDALLLVGQTWIEIGNYSEAIAAANKALTANPKLAHAHFLAGQANIRWEHWADAEKEFNAELAAYPGDPDARYDLGFVVLQQSRTDEAEKLFRQVIAAHPEYGNAQYQLGKLLMDQGKPGDALPHLESAAKLIPDKDYVHYQLQAAYRKQSRTADADRELAVYQELKAKARPHLSQDSSQPATQTP